MLTICWNKILSKIHVPGRVNAFEAAENGGGAKLVSASISGEGQHKRNRGYSGFQRLYIACHI